MTVGALPAQDRPPGDSAVQARRPVMTPERIPPHLFRTVPTRPTQALLRNVAMAE
jgi:hypothetical protein